jgi:hypothetical protein
MAARADSLWRGLRPVRTGQIENWKLQVFFDLRTFRVSTPMTVPRMGNLVANMD